MASTPGKTDGLVMSHPDSEAPEDRVPLPLSQMITESVLSLEEDEHKWNI